MYHHSDWEGGHSLEQATAHEYESSSQLEVTPKAAFLPALVLFILSPLIAELLLGTTKLTQIGGLMITMPLYGCGVLLIRELVRRRSTSWWPVLLFGAAYMLVEEGLALQTLFNPDFVNAAKLGGRWLGVNFVLTQWETGYHIVWSICIPIFITELLFPVRRKRQWLGKLGLTICAFVYALAVLVLGAVSRTILMPGFHAPSAHLFIVAGLACAFAISALTWPKAKASTSNAPNPSPRVTPPWWFILLLAALWAASLFALLFIPTSLKTTGAVGIILLGQLGFTALLVWRLKVLSANNPGWTNAHRWALVFGPVLVSSCFGLVETAGSRLDQIGVASFALVTLTTLLILATRDKGSVTL